MRIYKSLRDTVNKLVKDVRWLKWYVLQLGSGGGGGTPTLQEVTDEGNDTTNNVIVKDSSAFGHEEITIKKDGIDFKNQLENTVTLSNSVGNGGYTIFLPDGDGTLALLSDIGGGGSIDLGYTPSATNGTITNSGGDNAIIPLADTNDAGLMSATHFDQLSDNTTDISNHIGNTSNPHSVTKTQVGLSNVPNTDFTSAVAANTAKVTNATHTGDVVGNTTLTISNGAVDLEHLSATGTKDSTTFLRGDNTFATIPTGETSIETMSEGIACSDETTDLIVANGVASFRLPYAMNVTEIRAYVNDAPTGDSIEVDVLADGVSMLSTVVSIDATTDSSTESTTPAVISNATLGDNTKITVNIDQIGSSNAGAGLKIWLIGTKATSLLNFFMGYTDASISTPVQLAGKLDGIEASNISYFSKIGNHISCRIDDTEFGLANNEFNADTDLLYFRTTANCTSFAVRPFMATTNCTEVSASQVTTLGNQVFRDATAMETISLPSCTTLGDTTGDDGVFNSLNSGCDITVPSALSTDGDIIAAIANSSANIIYV